MPLFSLSRSTHTRGSLPLCIVHFTVSGVANTVWGDIWKQNMMHNKLKCYRDLAYRYMTMHAIIRVHRSSRAVLNVAWLSLVVYLTTLSVTLAFWRPMLG
jgi:hypothetical protein